MPPPQTIPLNSGRGEAQTTGLEAQTSTHETQINDTSFDSIGGGEVVIISTAPHKLLPLTPDGVKHKRPDLTHKQMTPHLNR